MGEKKTILEEFDENVRKYEYLREVATNLLKELLHGEKINSITSRVKDRKSLEGKIDRKGEKYQTISDITDIVGIRIITYYSDDVDKIADIIEKEFMIDKENSIDKRKAMEPDTFGYLSLHYVVNLSKQRQQLSEYLSVKDIKFEIQIRSILQHTWAEIEHDLGYKSNTGIPKEIRRDFSRLAGLLELADKEFLGIRKSLKDYKAEICESVAKQETDCILIDYISLSNYVENSNVLREMNDQIAQEKNTKISKASQAEYISMIRKLNYLQCNNIKALEEMIARNSEFAMKLAMGILQAGRIRLTQLIALFYICYAELVESGKGREEIVSYMVYCGFKDSKESTNAEFAERLLSFKE